jgi:hypothetical protein
MSSQNIYYTGQRVAIQATLKLNGAAIDVSGRTITARLVDQYRQGRATGTTAVECTKPGDVGVVLATWPSDETALIAPGIYTVEFSTDDGPYTHEGAEIDIRLGVA